MADYRELWLLGLPPLTRYLEFVEDAVVDAVAADRSALTSEWRTANEYYQSLERGEAGIANRAEHRALDECFEPLAARVKEHANYRRTFNALPTSFGMVELDKLIVDQRHVTFDFVEALQARMGRAPGAARLFDICMPLDAPEAPVKIRKVGSRRYVFECDSTDFRFHEPTLLPSVEAYESFGAVAGIVGLVVGFGANFLNAVQVGKRMLLNNGYHRACALRAVGVTHAPCIIQHASRVDELEIACASRVSSDAEFYFESARPPLLRDFFDPKIRKLLPIRKRVRQIEIEFSIRDHLVVE
jgi:hypothetical protein